MIRVKKSEDDQAYEYVTVGDLRALLLDFHDDAQVFLASDAVGMYVRELDELSDQLYYDGALYSAGDSCGDSASPGIDPPRHVCVIWPKRGSGVNT